MASRLVADIAQPARGIAALAGHGARWPDRQDRERRRMAPARSPPVRPQHAGAAPAHRGDARPRRLPWPPALPVKALGTIPLGLALSEHGRLSQCAPTV